MAAGLVTNTLSRPAISVTLKMQTEAAPPAPCRAVRCCEFRQRSTKERGLFGISSSKLNGSLAQVDLKTIVGSLPSFLKSVARTLTSVFSAEMEEEARQAGAEAFVRKPQPLSQVAQLVQRLIDSPRKRAASL